MYVKPSCFLIVFLLSSVAFAEEPSSLPKSEPKMSKELDEFLVKMEKQAQTIKSVSCDFTLTRYSGLFEEKTVKKGKLYYKKPERVHIDFEKPDVRQLFISKDRWWDYRPEAKFVRTGRRDKTSDADILALDLWKSPEKLRKNFRIKLLPTEKIDKELCHVLEVAPKDKKAKVEYTRALFSVQDKLLIPLKLKCFEPSGDYNIYEFKKLKLNPRLSDRMFAFKPDRDVIIEDVDASPREMPPPVP